jgi:hypothetical protein
MAFLLFWLPTAFGGFGFFGNTGQAVVPNGLIAYWPLDDNRAGKSQDFRGNGYDLILTNQSSDSATPLTNSIVGNGIVFSNSFGYTTITSGLATNFTVTFWVCARSFPGNYEGLVTSIGPGAIGTASVWFGVMFNMGYLEAQMWDGTQNPATGGPIPPAGVWNFVVAGLSNNVSLRFSANLGFVYATSAAMAPTAYSQFRVGFGDGRVTYGQGCDAIIDDVRVYSRWLPLTDQTNIFKAGWGGHTNAPVNP